MDAVVDLGHWIRVTKQIVWRRRSSMAAYFDKWNDVFVKFKWAAHLSLPHFPKHASSETFKFSDARDVNRVPCGVRQWENLDRESNIGEGREASIIDAVRLQEKHPIPGEEGCDLLGHAELANPYFLYLYDCNKGWTMEYALLISLILTMRGVRCSQQASPLLSGVPAFTCCWVAFRISKVTIC